MSIDCSCWTIGSLCSKCFLRILRISSKFWLKVFIFSFGDYRCFTQVFFTFLISFWLENSSTYSRGGWGAGGSEKISTLISSLISTLIRKVWGWIHAFHENDSWWYLGIWWNLRRNHFLIELPWRLFFLSIVSFFCPLSVFFCPLSVFLWMFFFFVPVCSLSFRFHVEYFRKG